MTKEEKAKAYDEAFEKAKMSYHTGDYDKDTLEMLEIIFPELRESEEDKDEKIRKWLIKYFNKADFNGMLEYVSGIKAEDILAWLEKQGEQKQDPCEHCDNVMLNCHNFPCIKKRAFEQGKSVFDVINKEDGRIRKELLKHLQEGAEGYEPAGGAEDYSRWLAWLEKKKSIEWSEVDEAIAVAIECFIQNSKEDFACNAVHKDDALKWFKSIKEKLNKGE